MLVSVRRRLAFLALPKTGTTAVEQALAPLCEIRLGGRPDVKHMNMRMFERFMLPYLRTLGAENTETFCVVREPVDWLGSWYRYRSRPELDGFARSTRGISFAEFVEGYLETPPKPFAQRWSIANFVASRTRRPGVTHLFRYENMEGLSRFIGERFGVAFALPEANPSPKGDLSLPRALRARLETERAEDFAIYADHAR